VNTLLSAAPAVVHATAYCLPADVQNAMDTAKFWTTFVAAGLGVIALIMIGIGMFFQNRRGDGGQMLHSLLWWIAGVVLVGAASGIASIFLVAPTNCIQHG